MHQNIIYLVTSLFLILLVTLLILL